MKYICLGYYDPAKHAGMTEDERNAMFDECFRIRRPFARERALCCRRSSSAS
jgi:hypothetical protein